MNVAMVSGWHVHAKSYADQLKKIPGCQITAVWDEDAARGKAWAEELSCAFYTDYEQILKDPSIDGVVICSPTSEHYALITKAAKAEKHIFTEKVLTFTKKEAEDIQKAVKENGVKFTISYLYKKQAEIRTARKMIGEGVLGQVTYMRVRNVHNGASANWLPSYFYDPDLCGGGAVMDLGAHGFYLLNWFLGRPETVSSTFTEVTGRKVEDNAVNVFTYSNGVIGVAETGFVASLNPFTLEVSGTKGTLLVRDGLFYANQETGAWQRVEQLEEERPVLIQQWVDSIQNGSQTDGSIEEAVVLSEMMERAYQAQEQGKTISFD